MTAKSKVQRILYQNFSRSSTSHYNARTLMPFMKEHNNLFIYCSAYAFVQKALNPMQLSMHSLWQGNLHKYSFCMQISLSLFALKGKNLLLRSLYQRILSKEH